MCACVNVRKYPCCILYVYVCCMLHVARVYVLSKSWACRHFGFSRRLYNLSMPVCLDVHRQVCVYACAGALCLCVGRISASAMLFAMCLRAYVSPPPCVHTLMCLCTICPLSMCMYTHAIICGPRIALHRKV